MQQLIGGCIVVLRRCMQAPDCNTASSRRDQHAGTRPNRLELQCPTVLRIYCLILTEKLYLVYTRNAVPTDLLASGIYN